MVYMIPGCPNFAYRYRVKDGRLVCALYFGQIVQTGRAPWFKPERVQALATTGSVASAIAYRLQLQVKAS